MRVIFELSGATLIGRKERKKEGGKLLSSLSLSSKMAFLVTSHKTGGSDPGLLIFSAAIIGGPWLLSHCRVPCAVWSRSWTVGAKAGPKKT
jgi:hypothetical protein